MSLPYQIEAMREQLGKGLRGAMAYVGASKPTYTCKHETGGGNSEVTENGLVSAPVALTFAVNGKRGAGWRIIVSIEASDTYTVRLWKPVNTTAKARMKEMEKAAAEGRPMKLGEVLDESSDVYCDVLQEVVERMYDRAINEKCGGFIPLS